MGDWEQKKNLVNELLQGMELARQLQSNLNVSSSLSQEPRELLIKKLLATFEKALAMVKWNGGGSVAEPSQAMVRMSDSPSSSGSPCSDDSDRDMKDQDLNALKRRKHLPTWTHKVRVTPGVGVEGHLHDGFSWRKCGQKDIFGAKYPRVYYRCTQRVQGCLATKQVQRSDKDPTTFEIVYRGKHTCTQGLNSVPPMGPRDHNQEYSNISTVTQQLQNLQQSQELLMSFRENLGVKLPWEIGDLKELQKLVIVRTQVTNLPQFPNWPNLQVLHLQHNAGLTEIPSSFFEQICDLRILDLSYTNISGLPNSFFYLERLRELYIRGCELFMELPPEIKRLKTLEKLDLDNTQITHLPREIQELTNLHSLSLCFYGSDQSTGPIIPSGVISKLTNLADLRIDIDPDDKRWDENIKAILPEFSTLRFLTALTLYIPRAKLLEHLLHWKYIDFKYMIGDHKKRLISREPLAVTEKFKESRYKLRFVNGEDVPKEINTILSHTKAFFLDRHMSIKSLSEFSVKYVQLDTCMVGECNEMEMLVDGTSLNENLLQYAEFLSVYYMKNLESIWRGPAPSRNCFHHLMYIAFHTCPKLTTIFTLDFLDNLSMLEDLVVEDCSRLTTLISHESSNVQEKRFLPRVKRLLLVYLPELVSISSGLLIGEGIEKIGFYYCPKLQSLSQQELSSQELKIIKGETKWWEELNWNQWEQARRPNEFNDIFSPINEEADVMSQLVAEMRSEFNDEADFISLDEEMISENY